MIKPSNTGKISTVVLWVCILITLSVFALFYFDMFRDVDLSGTNRFSTLLYWLYTLFFLTTLITGLFSLFRFFRKIKDEPGKAWLSLVPFSTLSILFALAFFFGDATALNISGYEGSENTYFWLKLTDSWLYAIYFLLGLTFFSVFAGILWSYFKNRR